MADVSILSRLVSGYQRNVDLSQNSLIVGSLKVGTSSPTELTKTILDKLILIETAADSDGTFDTRYTKKVDLASTSAAKGASLVGIQDTGGYFTGTTVEAALQELGTSLGTGTAAGISYDPTASGLTATNVQDAIDEVEGRVDTIEANYIPLAQKAANNGVATLDAGGKIPVGQLPNSVMEYKGTYNASTNTPSLVDGSGNTGDVYRTTVAGAGVNTLNFVVGDYAIYNGSTWEKAHSGSDAVVTVNGQAGVVVLGTDDISEGATNKYFTDERAQDAVGAALTDTATIDFTYNDGSNQITADVKDNSVGAAKLTTGVADQDTILGGNGSTLAVDHAPKIQSNEVAGEALSSGVVYAMRFGRAADAGFVAGRMYKADPDSSVTDNFDVIGLVRPTGAIVAGNSIKMVAEGDLTSTAHGLTVGEPVWLTTAGLLTQTAPTPVGGQAVVKLGTVKDANTIRVKVQIING